MKSIYNGHHVGKLDDCLLNNEAHYEYDNDLSIHLSSPVSAESTDRTTSNPINDDDHLEKQFMYKRNGLLIHDSSGYDALRKPFKYDAQRGSWSSPADFYFACTSHGFGVNTFTEVSLYSLIMNKGLFLPVYLISILLYTIPIFIIQTFLGQFSSSGIISVFRVSPLFKGVGYSMLLLNFVTLCYCSVVAAVPLLYAVNSFHSVIPWMACDNPWNTPNCSTHSTYNEDDIELPNHPTMEFFRNKVRLAYDGSTDFHFNWLLSYGVIALWFLILGVLLKKITFMGKLLRSLCLLMLLIFIVIFVRLCLHHEASLLDILSYFIEAPFIWNYKLLPSAFYMASWPLGLCMGNVLTLASYNTLRRDSEKLTYWVIGSQVLLTLMATTCGHIAYDYFEDHVGLFHYHNDGAHSLELIYLCYAYLFGSISGAHVWSFLFFSMLFLAELSGMIVQMKTLLTALFDEFDSLRSKKFPITIGLVGVLLLASLGFCTKLGFEVGNDLPHIAVASNVTLALILLLVTTWIYGRKRFQCDLQFMLGKTISNFKIFLIRFLTPIFIGIIILQIWSFFEVDLLISIEMDIVLYGLSLIIIPGYIVYQLIRVTSGSSSCIERLKRLLKPQDWYPCDADNRRFYEEVMGFSEMTALPHNEI